MSEPKLSGLSAEQSVLVFQSMKEIYDTAKDLYDMAKTDFYERMDKFFSKEVQGSSFEFDEMLDGNDCHEAGKYRFKVSQSRKVNVDWDLSRLKKVLGAHEKEVIVRSYELSDVEGLAAYVKSLGGEARLFKSFFTVSEAVDTSVLDNLTEVGEVDADEVAECCDVKLGKPWYRVTQRRVVRKARTFNY